MLEIIKKNGSLTFKISGDIDHHSVKIIKDAIDQRIIDERPGIVYLDLSEVSFMDSSGLGLILGRYQTSIKLGSKFALLKPSEAVCRIIKISGCERIINIIGKKEAI